MAVSFEEIEKKFDKIFGFIEGDLKRIITLHPGVNYAAALLVACACDTLAEYKYGRRGQGEKVLRKLLPAGPYRKVAKPIYDALRDGFAHGYNGYDILFDGQTLQIAIAWKRGTHLSVRKIKEVPNLILNVRQLCEALFLEFEKYRHTLKENETSRKFFLERYDEKRCDKKKVVQDANQILALKAIVSKADTEPLVDEKEAPWMAGFGALSDLSSENRRIAGVIEAEFETLDPEDLT